MNTLYSSGVSEISDSDLEDCLLASTATNGRIAGVNTEKPATPGLLTHFKLKNLSL
jgi:hypothetical protein